MRVVCSGSRPQLLITEEQTQRQAAAVASPPAVGLPFPSGVLRRTRSRFLRRSFRGEEAVSR